MVKRRGDRPKLTRYQIVKAFFFAAVILISTLLGAAGFSLWHFSRDLPSIETLKNYQPPQTTRVLDRKGIVIGEIFTERRTVIPMSKIPRVLVLSVLAAEDADFYTHEGLDIPGILRAVIRDLLSGRAAQGASTITQQTVKLLLLNPERTISRKIRELILARRLERQLSKDEILHLYLNHVNFGHARYGAQEASRYYFNKDVSDISLAEASLLAGIPQAPARLSPRRNLEAAKRRQAYVLTQLMKKRDRYWPDLSIEAIEEAMNAPIEIVPYMRERSQVPEVMSAARRALRNAADSEMIARGGFVIHTSIDAHLQEKAREALRVGLIALDKRQGYTLRKSRRATKTESKNQKLRFGKTFWASVVKIDDAKQQILLKIGQEQVEVSGRNVQRYLPANKNLSQMVRVGQRLPLSIVQLPGANRPASGRFELGPQGGVVMLDTRSRDILAIVGGYEDTPGFNRALQAVRQPGSTFKPIVYALALETRRFTPASLVLDAPASYDEWKPNNFETWNYEGAVRLREALAKSINLVAVRVIEALQPKQVVEFARSLGITSELDPSIALALGASGVRLIELVNAYTTFAAGGRWAPSRLIKKIVGPDGNTLALPPASTPHDVMSTQSAYLMTNMLESVVQQGTARTARKLKRPLAGKTGTSNDAKDAWFIGYSPNTALGVWVGFDDHRSLGTKESGSRSALPIWIAIMQEAERNREPSDFPVPSGVVKYSIDPNSGLLAYQGQQDSIEEVFIDGTQPLTQARPPNVVDANTFFMEQFGASDAVPSAP